MISNSESMEDLPYELQQSPRWAEERNSILRALTKDAEGLPMTTSQRLLMERMATSYAVSRLKETQPDYKPSPADRRALDQQWLAMTSEFNKQITIGEDKRRHAMIESIQKIVSNAIAMVPDERIREDLRKQLAQGFSEAGL